LKKCVYGEHFGTKHEKFKLRMSLPLAVCVSCLILAMEARETKEPMEFRAGTGDYHIYKFVLIRLLCVEEERKSTCAVPRLTFVA